jgi:hypothetical protein
MIEKFTGIRSRPLREYLDLDHTGDRKVASVVWIWKLVQQLPRGPTNFAIRTPGLAWLARVVGVRPARYGRVCT